MTTKEVKDIVEKQMNGEVGKSNIFVNGNTSLRKPGVEFEMTEEEVNEYNRCKEDPIYFIEKYCKMHTADGLLKDIKLRDAQKQLILENESSIVLQDRSTGVTTAEALKSLYDIVFFGKKVGLIAGNPNTAKEILDKVKYFYQMLPFFIQKGVNKFNQEEIELENGGMTYVYHITEPQGSQVPDMAIVDALSFTGKESKLVVFMLLVAPFIYREGRIFTYLDYSNNKDKYKNMSMKIIEVKS